MRTRAGDRRGKCRRRDRSRRCSRCARARGLRRGAAQLGVVVRGTQACASATADRRASLLRSLSTARRRDLVEHRADGASAARPSGAPDARRGDRTRRRAAPFLQLASNASTSSSRTGPSARVMRRTSLAGPIERVRSRPLRAEHRQRFAQPSRGDARLVHGGLVPCCAAGSASSSETSRCRSSAHRRGWNAPC